MPGRKVEGSYVEPLSDWLRLAFDWRSGWSVE
jgi:hypothetical protein